MATFVISDESPIASAEHSSGTPSSGSSSSRRVPSHKAALLRPFKSTRARPEELQDWTKRKRSSKEKFARLSPWITAGFGMLLVVGGAIWGWQEADPHTFTEYWYEDFKSGVLDLENDFNREVAFGGFGATSLEFDTNWDNNSYVKNHQLYIHPRLAPDFYNEPGAYLNLTEIGECTKPYSDTECYAQRNVSKGAWFNRVTSARLTTKGKHTIGYGRVEVHAKMALGDWLWNAIWMMPQNSTYGEWPASGEIDIIESRGNKPGYTAGGYDTLQTSLHAAPEGFVPKLSRLPSRKRDPVAKVPFASLSHDFHTFGVDITPQGVKTWVDSPIYTILDFKFHSDPVTNFDLPGDFGGLPVQSPWTLNSHKSAPFDQEFYLIINCAFGGLPGYFYDGYQAPWGVTGNWYTAQRQLWEAGDNVDRSWPKDDLLPLRIDYIRFSKLDNLDYWLNLPSANY